jgi:hypothetical protein
MKGVMNFLKSVEGLVDSVASALKNSYTIFSDPFKPTKYESQFEEVRGSRGKIYLKYPETTQPSFYNSLLPGIFILS